MGLPALIWMKLLKLSRALNVYKNPKRQRLEAGMTRTLYTKTITLKSATPSTQQNLNSCAPYISADTP